MRQTELGGHEELALVQNGEEQMVSFLVIGFHGQKGVVDVEPVAVFVLSCFVVFAFELVVCVALALVSLLT